MQKSIFPSRTLLKITFFFLSTGLLFAQKKSDDVFLGKADLYKAKKNALELASDPAALLGHIEDILGGRPSKESTEDNGSG